MYRMDIFFPYQLKRLTTAGYALIEFYVPVVDLRGEEGAGTIGPHNETAWRNGLL